MNSPNIYFIRNNEGKFYNAREKQFYSNIVNANFERDKKVLDDLLHRFHGCGIYETTENEFMQEMASITTNLVLSGSYFAELLNKHACKIPTISQVNKTMYQKCKIALDTLKPFTSLHSDFIDKKEEETDDVRSHYEQFIKEMSDVEIYQMGEVVSILQAYKIDKQSILGITKKVLR